MTRHSGRAPAGRNCQPLAGRLGPLDEPFEIVAFVNWPGGLGEAAAEFFDDPAARSAGPRFPHGPSRGLSRRQLRGEGDPRPIVGPAGSCARHVATAMAALALALPSICFVGPERRAQSLDALPWASTAAPCRTSRPDPVSALNRPRGCLRPPSCRLRVVETLLALHAQLLSFRWNSARRSAAPAGGRRAAAGPGQPGPRPGCPPDRNRCRPGWGRRPSWSWRPCKSCCPGSDRLRRARLRAWSFWSLRNVSSPASAGRAAALEFADLLAHLAVGRAFLAFAAIRMSRTSPASDRAWPARLRASVAGLSSIWSSSLSRSCA